jgi:hypothetical protein
LKIGPDTLIFLLCDGEELNYVFFFCWNACAKIKYDFGDEIMKMEDKAKI